MIKRQSRNHIHISQFNIFQTLNSTEEVKKEIRYLFSNYHLILFYKWHRQDSTVKMCDQMFKIRDKPNILFPFRFRSIIWVSLKIRLRRKYCLKLGRIETRTDLSVFQKYNFFLRKFSPLFLDLSCIGLDKNIVIYYCLKLPVITDSRRECKL